MNEGKVAHCRNRSDFDFIAQRNICLRPGHTGLTTSLRPVQDQSRAIIAGNLARLVLEIVNIHKIGCGVGYEDLRPYSNA